MTSGPGHVVVSRRVSRPRRGNARICNAVDSENRPGRRTGVSAFREAQHNASINPPQRIIGLSVSKTYLERELAVQRKKGLRRSRRRERVVGFKKVGEKRVRQQGLGLNRRQAQQP